MKSRALFVLALASAAFVRAEVDVHLQLGGHRSRGEAPRKVVVLEDRHDHRRCHHRHARGWHGHQEREVVVVEKRMAEPQPVLVVKEAVPAPAPQPVAPPEPPKPSRSMNSAD